MIVSSLGGVSQWFLFAATLILARSDGKGDLVRRRLFVCLADLGDSSGLTVLECDYVSGLVILLNFPENLLAL